MIVNGRCQGNSNAEVQVFPDAVRVHSNIVQLDENLFEYDEIVFTPEEYTEYFLKLNLPHEAAKTRANIDYNIMMGNLDDPEMGG